MPLGKDLHKQFLQLHYRTFKRILTAVSLTALLTVTSSCDEPPKKPEDEVKPIKLTETNPNAEPRCGCENSTGQYIENVSKRTRNVSWVISTRDTLSGKYLNPIEGSASLAPGQKEFLGCTIHAPSTQCRFQAKYSLGTVSTTRSTSGAMAAIYGATASPSLSTCSAWCSSPPNPSDPNAGECLPLGLRYYKGIAPLRELIRTAQTGNGTVARDEILASYGLSTSDDKCERSDVTTVDGRIVNEGKSEYCEIKSADLPARVLSMLGLAAEASDPLSMVTTMPQRLEAVPIGTAPLGIGSATDVAVFDSSANAPFIRFEGASGSLLTERFGGDILGLGRVALPGSPTRTIVATSNGCISIDEP